MRYSRGFSLILGPPELRSVKKQQHTKLLTSTSLPHSNKTSALSRSRSRGLRSFAVSFGSWGLNDRCSLFHYRVVASAWLCTQEGYYSSSIHNPNNLAWSPDIYGHETSSSTPTGLPLSQQRNSFVRAGEKSVHSGKFFIVGRLP